VGLGAVNSSGIEVVILGYPGHSQQEVGGCFSLAVCE
jgi:hypothetical protein